MKPVSTLDGLLVVECRNLYAACSDILAALGRLTKFAQSQNVRDGLKEVFGEAEKNLQNLKRIAHTLDIPMTGGTCHAVHGIIRDIDDQTATKMPAHVAEVAAINGVLHILRYRISAYDIARQVAERLRNVAVTTCLTESLEVARTAETKFVALTAGVIDLAARENTKALA